MPSSLLSFWTVRLITFLLWALAAASSVFWVLQTEGASDTSKGRATPSAGIKPAPEQNLTPQVALALGAKNPVAPTAAGTLSALQARFQLQGVLAAGAMQGAALISVDGKPAKPYRVGVAIEEGLEVMSVAARSAAVGKNGATAFTLELPKQDANLGLKK